ncbi:MAG: hypothetical protein DBY36_00280 [Clostridiales bacterium]|nr:MAG: hypothetical protein DBY36_00280 [Clostridiales bacterium]
MPADRTCRKTGPEIKESRSLPEYGDSAVDCAARVERFFSIMFEFTREIWYNKDAPAGKHGSIPAGKTGKTTDIRHF